MRVDTLLIMTHCIDGMPLLPHLSWLKDTNPNVDIHIIVGQDSPMGKKYNWKNSDQILRNWWIANRQDVGGQCIAIIEWDTLISKELPDMPDDFDLVGANMFIENKELRGNWRKERMASPNWHPDYWFWWGEIPKMELTTEDTAIGLISFGFMITRKWVLDSVCQTKWDGIYAESIQNELRFPTIASLNGAKVGEIDLPNVSCFGVEIGEYPDIYHGVKVPISLDYFKR